MCIIHELVIAKLAEAISEAGILLDQETPEACAKAKAVLAEAYCEATAKSKINKEFDQLVFLQPQAD